MGWGRLTTAVTVRAKATYMPTSTEKDSGVTIGDVRLKNPLICGSGEHLIDEAGMTAAINAGAGAVVMKSTSESEAAKVQLSKADYVLLDAEFRDAGWTGNPPREASLFNRSGLFPHQFEAWLELLKRSDAIARQNDSIVIASLIPADPKKAPDQVREMVNAGARIVEVNIGAPHAGEAAKGAILAAREANRVRDITEAVREVCPVPLWIKLTGQSEDTANLALAAKEGGADAVTIMGRFMAFVPDVETQAPMLGTFGAIGGAWALPITCRWVALARGLVGKEYPLLATNGARDGLDIVRFMLAGATAVQMTSAVMTGGFEVVERTLDELRSYLASKSVNASELIGRAADQLQTYADQEEKPDHWRNFIP